MDEVSLQIDAKGLEAALRKKPKQIFLAGKRSLTLSKNRFDRNLQTKRLRGRPGLKKRSGRLAQSFIGEVTGNNLANLHMQYGTNVKYAAIHEFGGVVRPKKGKYLTIPLKDNLLPSGVMKRSLRSFQFVYFRRSKKGSLLAFAGDDKDDMKPMFVLVRSVKIPARLGFRRLWIQERKTLILNINKAIREALR